MFCHPDQEIQSYDYPQSPEHVLYCTKSNIIKILKINSVTIYKYGN